MPQAAQDECDEQVYIGADTTFAAAAEGDVEIVA